MRPETLNTAPIPYESRIVRQLRGHEEAKNLDRQAARIAHDCDTELPPSPSAKTFIGSPAGDEKKLRGIPTVGVRGGLGGAIRGSRPGDGLD